MHRNFAYQQKNLVLIWHGMMPHISEHLIRSSNLQALPHQAPLASLPPPCTQPSGHIRNPALPSMSGCRHRPGKLYYMHAK